MVAIRINGTETPIAVGDLPRFSDIVELVRVTIDPEHMITEILLDGRELADDDWKKSPRALGDAVVEINTDTPERFVTERILDAPEAVQACYLQFRDARKTFQQGDSRKGNHKLAGAVHTLRTFFEWYHSVLQLMNNEQKKKFGLDEQVRALTAACNSICQQQLYQQWMALADTIENQLEPGLDALETFCRRMVRELN